MTILTMLGFHMTISVTFQQAIVSPFQSGFIRKLHEQLHFSNVSIGNYMAISVGFQQEITWLFHPNFNNKSHDDISHVLKVSHMPVSANIQQELT